MDKNAVAKKLSSILKKLLRVAIIIFCAFFINTIILLISGKSPSKVYSTLLYGAFGGVYNIARTIRWTVPLVFTGLAFTMSSRCGIFNIGASGQLYMGAFAAVWVGFTFTDLPRIILIPTALAAAIIAGALWSMLAGWIMIRFNASIIVITLMLNYIATLFTEYLVRYPFYTPGTLGESGSTQFISDAAKLTTLIPDTNVTTGVFIAIAAIVLIAFLDQKSVIGYECRIIGANERFASFVGLKVKKRQMLVFGLSGALAGLGGAVEVLGNYGRFMVDFSPSLGFDGVVVSLLAGGNPAMIPLSALFMGAMNSGSISVEMLGNVPRAMTGILMGIIIIVITVKRFPIILRKQKTADANPVK